MSLAGVVIASTKPDAATPGVEKTLHNTPWLQSTLSAAPSQLSSTPFSGHVSGAAGPGVHAGTMPAEQPGAVRAHDPIPQTWSGIPSSTFPSQSSSTLL